MIGTVLDTGATLNIVNMDLVDLLDLEFDEGDTGVRINTLTNVVKPLGEAHFNITMFGQQYRVSAQVVRTRILSGLLVGNNFMRAAQIDVSNSTGQVRFGSELGIQIPITDLWKSETIQWMTGVTNSSTCMNCSSQSKKNPRYVSVSVQTEDQEIGSPDQLSSGSSTCITMDPGESGSSGTVDHQEEGAGTSSSDPAAACGDKQVDWISDSEVRQKEAGHRADQEVRVTRWLSEEYGYNDEDLSLSLRSADEDDVFLREAYCRKLIHSQEQWIRERRRRRKRRRKPSRTTVRTADSLWSSDQEPVENLCIPPSDHSDACREDEDDDQWIGSKNKNQEKDTEHDERPDHHHVLFMPDAWEADGLDEQPDPEHDPVINPDLEEGVRTTIRELISRYGDIFSKGDHDIGIAKTEPAVLDTGDHLPISQVNYRQKPAMEQELDRQINQLLAAGIIEKSRSPWNSPPVLVIKKNKTYRLTINYQKLNNVLKKFAMVPPDIDVLLDRLGGMQFKTILDARSGYFHIPLDQESREKTAFRGPYGLYQFTRLPQGLATAPAIFQTAMNDMLGDLKQTCALAYMDDVIVFSRTIEDHMIHIQQVFQRISEFGLKMSMDKSKFAMHEIEFLGRLLTRNGVRADPKKVAAIMDYPQPITQKELMRFKGMCSYHRKLIPGFAKIMEPIQQMINDSKIRWGETQEAAFRKIKQRLTSAPILRFPDFTKRFYVACDASGTHLGALLKQKDESGHLCIVACASRKLTRTEITYAPTYRECLSVVYAVNQFDRYLTGQQFTIVVDHHSLCFMQKMIKPANSHLTRWIMSLQEYDFTIEWTSGRSHKEADTLSRPPGSEQDLRMVKPVIDERFMCVAPDMHPLVSLDQLKRISDEGWESLPRISQEADQELVNEAIITIMTVQEEESDHAITQISDLAQKQDEDEILLGYKLFFRSGAVPAGKKKQRFRKKMQHYLLKDDILHRRVAVTAGHIRECPVIPSQLIMGVISAFHDSPTAGHQGIRNTLSRIRNWFFWERMEQTVDHYVRTCETCLRYNIVRTTPSGEMFPLESTCMPGEILQMDTMTNLTPTPAGNECVFTCTDRSTRYVWGLPSPTKEAHYAVKLLRKVIRTMGPPKEVLTDNGKEYDNRQFDRLCDQYGIRHVNTSRHHPQTNGQTERMNSTIMQVLRKYATGERAWDDQLDSALYVVNTSPNNHTKFSPYELMFGMHPPPPIRLTEGQISSPSPYDWRSLRIIEDLRQVAADRLAAAQREYKRKHDERVPANQFQPGQWVMLRRHVPERGLCRKLSSRYAGPYQIKEVFSNNTVELIIGDQNLCSNRVNIGEIREALQRDPAVISGTSGTHLPPIREIIREETSSDHSDDTEIVDDRVTADPPDELDEWDIIDREEDARSPDQVPGPVDRVPDDERRPIRIRLKRKERTQPEGADCRRSDRTRRPPDRLIDEMRRPYW